MQDNIDLALRVPLGYSVAFVRPFERENENRIFIALHDSEFWDQYLNLLEYSLVHETTHLILYRLEGEYTSRGLDLVDNSTDKILEC